MTGVLIREDRVTDTHREETGVALAQVGMQRVTASHHKLEQTWSRLSESSEGTNPSNTWI